MLAGKTQENNEIHLRLHFTLYKFVNVIFYTLLKIWTISERNNKQSDKKRVEKKMLDYNTYKEMISTCICL